MRIGRVARYDEAEAKAAGRARGSVMTVAFELDGQEFTALNGGPLFTFTEAISFVVNCETQDEVDHFWDKLSAGGQQVQCVEESTRGTMTSALILRGAL